MKLWHKILTGIVIITVLICAGVYIYKDVKLKNEDKYIKQAINEKEEQKKEELTPEAVKNDTLENDKVQATESISEQIRKKLNLDSIKEDGKYSYNKNMAIFKELWNRSKKCSYMIKNANDDNLEKTVQNILNIIPCSDLKVCYDDYKEEGYTTIPDVRKDNYRKCIEDYRYNLLASNLKYSDEDIMSKVEEIIFSDDEGISGSDDIFELFSSTDMGDIMAYANGSDVVPLNISQLFAEYDQAEVNDDHSNSFNQASIEEKVQQQIGSEKIADMTIDELYDKLAEIEQQRFYESLDPYERFQYDLWSIKGPYEN